MIKTIAIWFCLIESILSWVQYLKTFRHDKEILFFGISQVWLMLEVIIWVWG